MSFFENTSTAHIPGGTFNNVGGDINNLNAPQDINNAGRDINITNANPGHFVDKRTVLALAVLLFSTVFIVRYSRMSIYLFPDASNVQISGGNFINAGRDINSGGRDTINAGHDAHVTNTVPAYSVFSILQEHNVPGAAYNARDHESVPCQEGTRRDTMAEILKWANGDDDRTILWLYGPAGSGKSTIAHTVAKEQDAANKLAASFFFSRGKPGRGDASRLFATLAYQLAESIPSIHSSMLESLQNNPSILSQTPRDQLQKLILNHVWPFATGHMVVVINGLDECDEEGAIDLIQALAIANLEHPLPFRLFLTSRADEHIRETFSDHLSRTYHFDLGKVRADNDIGAFLKSRFSELYRQKRRIMTAVKPPWPPDSDLDIFVQKAEGLFVYASTLVKFVADGRGLPHRKLQLAMERHNGLDHLYEQVLSDAPHSKTDYFRRIIGTLLFLLNPLSIDELALLLRIDDPGMILAVFHGCGSILNIPDNNDKAIRVFHTSLRDFLVDVRRSGSLFIDPTEHHIFILDDCVRIMMQDFMTLSNNSDSEVNGGQRGGQALSYACQHWYHHMISVTRVDGGIGRMNSYFGRRLVDFLTNVHLNWFHLWVECGSDIYSMGNNLFTLISIIEGYSSCSSELCRGLHGLLEFLNSGIACGSSKLLLPALLTFSDPQQSQPVCNALGSLLNQSLLPHPGMCT